MKKFLAVIFTLGLLTYPFSSNATEIQGGNLNLSCPSAILMDYSTGQILYEKNPDEKLPMASVTKIMTMLLAMEEIDAGRMNFDDIITASANAKSYGGSTIFLEEGEQMTVSDILKGIAVASGNDAAVAMGEHISGTEAMFVEKMNNRASELGMVNTHFVNCNGLDADGHYSSARDIAIMSRELMKHDAIFGYTTIWMDSLRNGNFTLSNTNKLVRFYEGTTGLKTGSTGKAKFCISATAKRDNLHLIAVIMAAETSKQRQKDASDLLNYGFSTYSNQTVVESGAVITIEQPEKSTVSSVELLTQTGYNHIYKKTDKVKVETKKEIKKIKAPLKKGDVAGTLSVYINDSEVSKINLVCSCDVPKANFGFVFKNALGTWLFAA